MVIKNRKLIGILLIVLPPLVLVCTLSFYAISSFVLSQLADATSVRQSFLGVPYAHAAPSTDTVSDFGTPIPLSSDFAESTGLGEPYRADSGELVSMIGNLIRVGLGFLGIVAVLGVLFGMPFGLYLIATDTGSSVAKHRSLGVLSQAYLLFAGMTILFRIPDLFVKIPDLQTFEDIADFIGGLSAFTITQGIFSVLFHLIATIIFLFWLGRAGNNLKLILKSKLKIDPFYLAWGNLIPVYNLFHSIITFPHFWSDVSSHYHVAKTEISRVLWAIRIFFIVDVVGFLLASVAQDLGGWLGLTKVQGLQIENYASFVFFAVGTASLMYFVHTVTKYMEKR